MRSYVSGAGLGWGSPVSPAAATGLGSAGSPPLGRTVDRFAPLPVVLSATAQLLVCSALLSVARLEAPSSRPRPGRHRAANPQIGAIARARWSALARRRGHALGRRARPGLRNRVRRGGFVLGPVIAGVLVGVLGVELLPSWCSWCGAARSGGASSSTSRSVTEPDPGHPLDRGQRHGSAPRIRWAAGAAADARLCVGTVFGSTQTVLTRPSTPKARHGGVHRTNLRRHGRGQCARSLLVSRLPSRAPWSVRVACGCSSWGHGWCC
ncbi:hypothetical protein QJS66_13245 [Kocuria rhizophila]|nr:hypothetical protein QJS66_13245 [Kocuria rhizophila]